MDIACKNCRWRSGDQCKISGRGAFDEKRCTVTRSEVRRAILETKNRLALLEVFLEELD